MDYPTLTEQSRRNTAIEAEEMNLVSILRPRVFMDGDRWCVLYGEDLMNGIAGFGETPMLAVYDFNKAWHKKIGGARANDAPAATAEGVTATWAGDLDGGDPMGAEDREIAEYDQFAVIVNALLRADESMERAVVLARSVAATLTATRADRLAEALRDLANRTPTQRGTTP